MFCEIYIYIYIMDWLLKIMDWVLYDRDLRHERVKAFQFNVAFHIESRYCNTLGCNGGKVKSSSTKVKVLELLFGLGIENVLQYKTLSKFLEFFSAIIFYFYKFLEKLQVSGTSLTTIFFLQEIYQVLCIKIAEKLGNF